MIRFTPAQESRIAATLGEVDRLLSRLDAVPREAALRSPFARYGDDTTTLQRDVIAHFGDEVRSAMREILERLQVDPPVPAATALGDCRAIAARALIEAQALAPRYLRSEGPLPEALEAEVNRMLSRIVDPLETIDAYLEQSAADLRMRPDAHTDAAPTLSEIESLVVEYGLTDLVPELRALAERRRAHDLEIAVFGRVNAGKSSLLNALLGAPVLPAAGLPVTSVPVEVAYAERSMGQVRFAQRAPERFTADRLREFASEHFNPGNSLHVTQLLVEWPAPLLARGVRLIDMPGIVPGETRSYLRAGSARPCDVGIVALDSANTPGFEELVLIDRLRRSGTEVVLAITKADRLSTEERWRVYASVTAAIASRTGWHGPAFLTSAVSGDPVLASDWIQRGIEPLIARRQEVRERSLGAKAAILQARAMHEIERRKQASSAPDPAQRRAHAAAALAEALDWMGAAAGHGAPRESAERHAAALVEEVAHNCAVLWPLNHEPTFDMTPLVESSLLARVQGYAQSERRALRVAKARCVEALEEAALGAGEWPGRLAQLPLIGYGPAFSPEGAAGRVLMPRPPLHFLGVRWRRRMALRFLDSTDVRMRAATVLCDYFAEIEEWRLGTGRELEGAVRGWMREFNETGPRLRAVGSARSAAAP